MKVTNLAILTVVGTCVISVVQGWMTTIPTRRIGSTSNSIYPRTTTTTLYSTTSTPIVSSSSSTTESTTSTPTTTSTTTTTTTTNELSPEYAAALEMIVQTVSKNLPESMKTKIDSSSTSSSNMVGLLLHFAKEYMMASQHANDAVVAGTTIPSPAALTDAMSSAQRFIKGVQYGFQYGLPSSSDLYTFDVSHVALDGAQEEYGGIDYYSFGCHFFRPVMDITSVDVNVAMNSITNLEQIQNQIQNGENVIVFANHQSEADPQVVSACLELVGYTTLAKEMIYVAGHKVTTDPLAIPFSMGRNLLCIHSKKHIDANPDTKPIKQKQNLKAMNALLTSLKEETRGSVIWVAPSGGRDRRNVETNTVPIAPFDSKTIDMFRLMGNKSKRTTHYYTMAMVSYDLCPPPDFVEAGVGESRNVRFSPVGIIVGNELPSVGGLESRQSFCTDAQQQCEQDYTLLQQALFNKSPTVEAAEN